MRKMSAVVSDAADILVKVIGMAADKGKEVNIYDLYQGLTLDVIGKNSIFFSISVDMKFNCLLLNFD
jgi:hypothetical protein